MAIIIVDALLVNLFVCPNSLMELELIVRADPVFWVGSSDQQDGEEILGGPLTPPRTNELLPAF